jgi:DNA polymerase-3 subunit delta'
MPWNRILDQARPVRFLQRALETDRVGHAYLFHGPSGTGKRATALAFAQALQCERRGQTVGAGEACGRCLPCTKVARLIHPDVHVFLPQPKDAAPEDLAARLAALAREPYAAVDFRRRPSLDDAGKVSGKMVIYSADQMREAVMPAMRYAPAEGRYNIALLTDADEMPPAAANPFLKLLEEPPPKTLFVLTAERPDRILPTILSRCQRLRFDPLAPEAIEGGLRERVGVPHDRAAFLARMADGSFSRALALIEDEALHAQRALVVQFLRAAFSRNPSLVVPAVQEMAGLGRERIGVVLGLLGAWVRDLVLAREAGRAAPLINADQAEAVHKFVQGLPNARLDLMAALVEEAATLAARNVNATLLLTVLADALHEAMHGRARDVLIRPLAA